MAFVSFVIAFVYFLKIAIPMAICIGIILGLVMIILMFLYRIFLKPIQKTGKFLEKLKKILQNYIRNERVI